MPLCYTEYGSTCTAHGNLHMEICQMQLPFETEFELKAEVLETTLIGSSLYTEESCLYANGVVLEKEQI